MKVEKIQFTEETRFLRGGGALSTPDRVFLLTVGGRKVRVSAVELLNKRKFQLVMLNAVQALLDPPKGEELRLLLDEARKEWEAR